MTLSQSFPIRQPEKVGCQDFNSLFQNWVRFFFLFSNWVCLHLVAMLQGEIRSNLEANHRQCAVE